MGNEEKIKMGEFSNLVEMVRVRAQVQPNHPRFTFLKDGEDDAVELDFQSLDQFARTIGGKLQTMGLRGERAILLYPPGLEYIAGFFGSIFAGVIAVPAYPPDPSRLERTLPRLQAIIRDCQAKVILTTQPICSMAQFLSSQAPDLAELEWVATDTIDKKFAEIWDEPSLVPEQPAFLQYTSGSTGDPKGVILSHANLLHNLGIIQRGFGVSSTDHGVSWLPPYHDMGLIGGILEPLYLGIPIKLMSPLHFLQKPLRWLQAISRFKATASGGPNFAFELCVRKTTPEERKGLDLSQWSVAFTGAEPILPETIDRFVEVFEPCGFRREAFYPCYGLAEGTLMVSGGKKGTGAKIKLVPKEKFKRYQFVGEDSSNNDFFQLVGCGTTFPDQEIVIIRPDTLKLCQGGEVGEIWVKGPSIARGYWNRKDETKETFEAFTKDNGEGPFLRTGDLGFLDHGELFVTGRLKDLIIIRGDNHYPQDIERTVEGIDTLLRSGCGAAFSIKEGYEERLVIVQEVEEPGKGLEEKKLEEITQSIRSAIATHHELEATAIVLLKKGTIPKTSSGKIRRHACREAFLSGALEVVAEYRAPSRLEDIRSRKAAKERKATPSVERDSVFPNQEEIQTWLMSNLADYLGIDAQELNPRQPLADFGLDSKDAVNISGELQDWLGVSLSPTLLWKYPTIEGLAQYLAREDWVAQVIKN